AFELDALDRAVAHVALADRDGGGLAVFARPSAPSPAFDALHDEAALGLRMHAKEYDRAAEEAVVGGRHAIAHRRRQRLDGGVDHRWHDGGSSRHRRG